MRQGLTPEISAAKQTNLQYLVKLRAAPQLTLEPETAKFTQSAERPHRPPLPALPPRRHRRKPAQESQPGLKTACKGTEKNRNERMSKSEISKKNRPPKGGRVCSLRSQGAQDCPWLRLGTLVNPAHSCSRQHTSEHFRPHRNTLDPMTTRMLLRREPHRSSHRNPRQQSSRRAPKDRTDHHCQRRHREDTGENRK